MKEVEANLSRFRVSQKPNMEIKISKEEQYKLAMLRHPPADKKILSHLDKLTTEFKNKQEYQSKLEADLQTKQLHQKKNLR
jgi:hypothetical protein